MYKSEIEALDALFTGGKELFKGKRFVTLQPNKDGTFDLIPSNNPGNVK